LSIEKFKTTHGKVDRISIKYQPQSQRETLNLRTPKEEINTLILEC
jgi:hypothetical protein